MRSVVKGPRAVLFDLDGTLVDTAPDLGHAANLVRAESGLSPLSVSQYRPVASAGARGLLKVAFGIDPDHADFPARRETFLTYYRKNLARKSRLFPGMDRALADLERRRVPWGVVTNKPQWLTDPLMQELNLAARAAVTIGATEALKPKPAPDGLLRACFTLGLPAAECVYVGDDLRDVMAAHAAGMPVAAAAWGYVDYGEPIERWGADAILQEPEELGTLWP
ncbi:MAG: HAD family hydrolase [Nevskiaceae bacterium]